MNFQYIVPVQRSKDYLDVAFRKAREKSSKKIEGEWLEKIKKKEMIRFDVIKDQLVDRLDKVVKSFPSLDHLPHFYIKLKQTLKELNRDDFNHVESILLELFRMRRGKIVKLADSIKLNSDIYNQLTV